MSKNFGSVDYIDAKTLSHILAYPQLVHALEQAFVAGAVRCSPRQHLDMGNEREWLLMPAWDAEGPFGIKLVSVFDRNPRSGYERINGVYLLFDGENGLPVAMLDGGELTARRTAAVSAAAGRKLAGPVCRTLLIVGTGKLAPYLAEAHSQFHEFDRVLVWGRDNAAATGLANILQGRLDLRCEAVENLEEAVRNANFITAATASTVPLISGEWLAPGTHLDLVGGYRPDMREVDDAAVRRSRVFVDTYQGTFAEAGDIIGPLANAVLERADIVDLADLLANRRAGRTDPFQITLFKSVGHALSDLTAARLVHTYRTRMNRSSEQAERRK